MQVLLPLILQKMMTDHGRLIADHSRPCEKSDGCEASLFGVYVPVASLALYVNAASVFCQMLAFLSFGALADYGKLRKNMLMLCTVLGAASCIAYPFVMDGNYAVIAGLSIAGNVLYGLCIVFYNPYLSLLAANHPQVKSDADDRLQTPMSIFGFSKAINRWTPRFMRK